MSRHPTATARSCSRWSRWWSSWPTGSCCSRRSARRQPTAAQDAGEAGAAARRRPSAAADQAQGRQDELRRRLRRDRAPRQGHSRARRHAEPARAARPRGRRHRHPLHADRHRASATARRPCGDDPAAARPRPRGHRRRAGTSTPRSRPAARPLRARPGGAAEAANNAAADVQPGQRCGRRSRASTPPTLDLHVERRACRSAAAPATPGAPTARRGSGRPRDRAARARVRGQLLQPGGLLPRREALRAASPTATWS